MKKRGQYVITLMVVLGALALPAGVVAQNAVTQLSADLEYFFQELGRELVPNLQTAAVMNHDLGSAQLGDFPRMHFSLSAGATLDRRGVLGFTKEEFRDNYENYGVFSNLFEEIGLEEGGDIRDITDNYLPLPSIRMGIGVGLARGWELSVQAGLIPQAATDFALGFADSSEDDDFDISSIKASITTVGTRVRKVLVQQERGLPAISVGAGYIYSGINMRVPLEGLDLELDDNASLALEGNMDFIVHTHSFGLDVRASRRFLRVFYPFIGVASYYQFTDYTAGATGFAGTIVIDGNDSRVEPAITPASEQTFHGFNTMLSTGFDMKLAIFNLFLHGNYALNTRAPGAIAGMRLQF